MDAFEQLVSEILWMQRYWVRTSVKVELTKEEKREIGRALIAALVTRCCRLQRPRQYTADRRGQKLHRLSRRTRLRIRRQQSGSRQTLQAIQ
jgi:hypothetical protein